MEHVTVTDEGPIRIVTLNNPAKGNAISKPMGEAMQAAMRECEARDDLRCAIRGLVRRRRHCARYDE